MRKATRLGTGQPATAMTIAVAVRRLGPEDTQAITEHFLRLDQDGRYHRFFGAASDEAIRRYVTAFDWTRQILFGAECGGRLCALSEIGWPEGSDGSAAEFAISVDAQMQHIGLAAWLLDAVAAAAAAAGVRLIQGTWLTENLPIYRLMRDRGATIRQAGTVMTGQIALPPVTATSAPA